VSVDRHTGQLAVLQSLSIAAADRLRIDRPMFSCARPTCVVPVITVAAPLCVAQVYDIYIERVRLWLAASRKAGRVQPFGARVPVLGK
jgi:hypothetical protein